MNYKNPALKKHNLAHNNPKKHPLCLYLTMYKALDYPVHIMLHKDWATMNNTFLCMVIKHQKIRLVVHRALLIHAIYLNCIFTHHFLHVHTWIVLPFPPCIYSRRIVIHSEAYLSLLPVAFKAQVKIQLSIRKWVIERTHPVFHP